MTVIVRSVGHSFRRSHLDGLLVRAYCQRTVDQLDRQAIKQQMAPKSIQKEERIEDVQIALSSRNVMAPLTRSRAGERPVPTALTQRAR